MSVIETEIPDLKGKIVARAYRYDENTFDPLGHAVALEFTDGSELHLWAGDDGRVVARIDDDCIPDAVS